MKKPDKMEKFLLLNKIARVRDLVKKEACADEKRELVFHLEDLEQDLLGIVKSEENFRFHYGDENPVMEAEYSAQYPETYRLR